mmetsp:Transcript_15309/g.14687  ORF Transcript_15309/g.14687 Transcript_15309/m.14687 type:complete len:476 (+) Transcript_15309:143-1570(+)|eukprot:CAMPEP_0119051482 /NCGR_PEP_ID=MMETSP1177-20130426/73075_1 /TAXON_ID=2985 /ORGANISM="Ochromonas sp, Strain CCMP1899" /LENGTH=475 /DNA_ID=CAMNT_0007030689 /DNA_START=628 /DNA_END=2055 /DNA_ORIENTATION=+
MQSILIASFAAVASAQSLNVIPYTGSVDLGGCTNSAIHAGTAIHFDGGTTTIEAGDIDVSPGEIIDGKYVLKQGVAHFNDAYAKSCAESSKVAYNQAMGRKCNKEIASDLAGLTLTPGVYCTPTEKFVVSAATVTFDAQGDSNAEWIFQTAETVNTAGYTSMKLANNAQANNVYWAVGSAANLGAYSNFIGNILANTAINIGTSSAVVGRALGQTAVTFADDGKSNKNSQQSIGLPTFPVPVVINKKRSMATPQPISLGGCQDSALQAATSISFSGEQTVIRDGEIGVAPGTSITGNFRQDSGSAHRNDAYAQRCAKDQQTAYDEARMQPCTATIQPELSGLTLTPGVYCSTGASFTLSSGDLTLNALGNPFAKFTFITKETVITSTDTRVLLIGGGSEEYVYWAIGTSATLGSTSKFIGNMLAAVSITFGSGSEITGRGLAQTAISFATDSEGKGKGSIVGIPTVTVTVAKKQV